jgi:signal transduction histidine kinase
MTTQENYLDRIHAGILRIIAATTGTQTDLIEKSPSHPGKRADEAAGSPNFPADHIEEALPEEHRSQGPDNDMEDSANATCHDFAEIQRQRSGQRDNEIAEPLKENIHCRVLEDEGEVFGVLRFTTTDSDKDDHPITAVNQQALEDWVVDIEQSLHHLKKEDEALRHHVNQIQHEIVMRLQNVIALTENLTNDYYRYDPESRLKELKRLLYGALAMDTVVQNLGGYLGQYHFHTRSIALMVHEAKSLYEDEARRRHIRIQTGLPWNLHQSGAHLHQFEVSALHLQYALNNLMHNAVKYSFSGTPQAPRTVVVTGHREDEWYVLTVENYGVGILPEEVESSAIFRDGYQGKLTLQEYRRGAGKGLYFVARIINRHHGRIVVTSSADTNIVADPKESGVPYLNRFSIYLPLKQSHEVKQDDLAQ